MDFGKYQFEQNKKLQAAKKKQKQIQIKEIKFRPGTEEGDYQVKLRSLIKFLNDGDKTKITVRFKGRELTHRELGMDLLKRIETDLAPTFDQPWRRYGRVLSGPTMATRGSGKMPSDPGKWLKELRDLRIDSAEGDPAHEIEDFGKKLTRGLPAGSSLSEQSATQARAFAAQVLAMPPDVFRQREAELARLAAKQELVTRNRQRVFEGKPVETFDPYRWLVEEVMLSPRAAVDFRDRAAAR